MKKPRNGNKEVKNWHKKSHQVYKHIGCECDYCMHGWYQWISFKKTGLTKREKKYNKII